MPTGSSKPAMPGLEPCTAGSGEVFGYTSISFTTQSLSLPLVAANRSTRGAPMMCTGADKGSLWRSEEHTSELQSLMRISYAVFCLKKKKKQIKSNLSEQRCDTNYKIHNSIYKYRK